MEKLYGYKEKDVLGLARFIKERKRQSLTEVFDRYAEVSGKSRGTVRNLYYAIARRAVSDAEFRDKYLDGKIPEISKITAFHKDEEEELIRQVLAGKKEGRSVRSVIMELAAGDGKKALRFQNKFRGVMKNNPAAVYKIAEEMGIGEMAEKKRTDMQVVKGSISETQFCRLKTEINNLVNKIAAKEKKENEYLKNRIAALELENLSLRSALYGGTEKNTAFKYFSRRKNNKATER